MSGKSLSIIAGIMTILATWVFCWFYVGSTYWYGFGGLANFINIVIIPYNSYMVDDFAKIYSSPTMVYIVAFLALLFLISGPLQLIGAKKRALAIIGSIVPLIISIIILLIITNISPLLSIFLIFFTYDVELVPGIIPFHYSILGRPESIGAYFLIIGAFLGLISGFMRRD